MDYFTNYQITSPDFFAGMKEALVKYAVWHNGEQYVGCGIHTLKTALIEVDKLEEEWRKQHECERLEGLHIADVGPSNNNN